MDTPFSVSALEDLPPLQSYPPQVVLSSPTSPPPPPREVKPTGRSFQSNFNPPRSFPTLFDPFKNFFNLQGFPGVPTSSPTTPHTTPRIGASSSTKPFTTTTTTTSSIDFDGVSRVGNDFIYYYDDSDSENAEDNTLESEVSPDYSFNTSSCPGSLKECLSACSPVIQINKVAYKLCVNECLERCA